MLLSAVTLLAGAAASASAAAPEVTALVPAGGQRGTSVEITLAGKPGTLPLQVHAREPGLAFAAGKKPGTFTVTVSPEARPGVHRVRLHNAEGATRPLPFVVGTLVEETEVEPNDQPDQAASSELSRRTINGALAKGADVDVFAVPLETGQTLVASLLANRSLGSPMDGTLQILAPGGNVLVQNDDDHGLDPFLTWRALEGGTHFVRLFAFPEKTNSSVALSGNAAYHYRLTLTTGPFVDYVQPLAIGPQTTTVATRGWNLPDELRTLPASTTSLDESATQVPVFHQNLPEGILLPRTAAPALVESAADAQPMPLPVPSSVTGVISAPEEVDEYALTLTKGEALQLQVSARSMFSLLDPHLSILRADGTRLKELDDEARNQFDVNLVWAAPADGTYTIRVQDVFRHGSPRHFYRLSVEPARPEFKLSLESGEFTLTPGQPLEIPVTIARTRSSAEVSVSIRGLPAGIRVPAVVSAAKGDTAKKVTLKLNVQAAAALAGGYPFEVVGHAVTRDDKQPAEEPQTALVAADSGGYQSAGHWLTVLKVEPVVAPRPAQ